MPCSKTALLAVNTNCRSEEMSQTNKQKTKLNPVTDFLVFPDTSCSKSKHEWTTDTVSFLMPVHNAVMAVLFHSNPDRKFRSCISHLQFMIPIFLVDSENYLVVPSIICYLQLLPFTSDAIYYAKRQARRRRKYQVLQRKQQSPCWLSLLLLLR